MANHKCKLIVFDNYSYELCVNGCTDCSFDLVYSNIYNNIGVPCQRGCIPIVRWRHPSITTEGVYDTKARHASGLNGCCVAPATGVCILADNCKRSSEF